MFNKLFTRILDSSIWLEPVTTRVVWITLLATMDEDGYCHFAALENLSRRAGVTLKDAEEAVVTLTSPDAQSSDPSNDGKRVERVPGGFIVLNAPKFRAIANRERQQELTRARVAKFRAKQAAISELANETKSNDLVTPSEAEAEAETKACTPSPPKGGESAFEKFWSAYPRKVQKQTALRAFNRNKCSQFIDKILTAIEVQAKSTDWKKDGGQFIPYPATWLNAGQWDDDPKAYGNHQKNAGNRSKGNDRNAPFADGAVDDHKRQAAAHFKRQREQLNQNQIQLPAV